MWVGVIEIGLVMAVPHAAHARFLSAGRTDRGYARSRQRAHRRVHLLVFAQLFNCFNARSEDIERLPAHVRQPVVVERGSRSHCCCRLRSSTCLSSTSPSAQCRCSSSNGSYVRPSRASCYGRANCGNGCGASHAHHPFPVIARGHLLPPEHRSDTHSGQLTDFEGKVEGNRCRKPLMTSTTHWTRRWK